MIHNAGAGSPGPGLAPPLAQGSAALLIKQKASSAYKVTTPESFNQVVPFYVSTSGPLLHVHSHFSVSQETRRRF
jgi:hypothetical protein